MHMHSPATGARTVDFSNRADREHARRIGRAWIELRRGAAAVGLRSYLFGAEEPLEQGQMDALDLLTRRDERPMKELAARLRVEPSTATRAMQRLETDGLVERFTSPDDRRVVLVRITDEGRRRHDDVAARRSTAMMHILSAFDPEERSQLADLLDRLIASIDDVVTQLEANEADDTIDTTDGAIDDTDTRTTETI
jgi:DNA-binding MarR family transcriptional regulator